MGRSHSKRRKMTIRIKQKRRKKLAKLRQAYIEAKNKEEKEKVLEKVFQIAPWLTKEEFLSPLKKKD